ncbi:uncharacterized mitochondrial protein-like protein, partial [Tanacetum coccineum]
MLSAVKLPLFFWAEAIATACFTQNRSLVIPLHEKTPYHIINGRKPSVKFFYIFGSLYYIFRDRENLDKMKEKCDACIFVGYSTQSKGYRVYNKRIRLIVETNHVNFDELPQIASDHDSSGPAPQSYETVTMSLQELEMLFGLMFDEYFNGATLVVSKSSVVTTVDASNQCQQPNTTPSTSTIVATNLTQLNIQTTPEPTTQAPTLTTTENINQAENAQTKDHPLEQVLRNPSQPVRTRQQLDIDGEMYMFTLTVSQTEPKNIKEDMADHPWIEAMQDELHHSTNLKPSKKFEKLMHNKFEMSMMGELKFFLGIQIHQSPRGIFLNQAKYAQEILKKHGMTSCDSIGTPMATKPLNVDCSGTPVYQTKYHSMVGSLMYLTESRPYIVHATCYCARYQARPAEKHLKEVKRIFRYLKNTIHMGLWYPKDTSFELTAFLDFDHAGCFDIRKSTSGGIQFLGGDKLISWSSRKQDCTSMSTAEAG